MKQREEILQTTGVDPKHFAVMENVLLKEKKIQENLKKVYSEKEYDIELRIRRGKERNKRVQVF